ncbi:TPA: hypothetical protein NJV69_002539 [Corynebacterium striatum]|nr:hypothetical protein [Corynebacterium striatum]HCG2985177.1 hypothetical protein [Corynebacterium striatum]HCG3000105.1 hypothetical protein [Corynebacterium striatum]HCG3015755.1 hypothetical protein [Corynebacterium striatum]HCG3143521.1 hypothetical protein [Corynebacterium striatum]
MRSHRIRVSPRGVTLDGIPLLHSDEGPTIETILPNLHRVHLTVYAGHIQLDGDNHHTPEDTPIYYQLKKEA